MPVNISIFVHIEVERNPLLLASITIIFQAQASISPPQCNDYLGFTAKVNKWRKQSFFLLRRALWNDFGAHICLPTAREHPARLILRHRRPYTMICFKHPTKNNDRVCLIR